MNRYTKEQIEWLNAYIPGHKSRETAEAFNKRFDRQVTPEQVHSYQTNHKIHTGTKKGKPAGCGGPVWTKELCDYLREINYGKIAQEAADAINAKFNTSFSRMQIKGIRARLHLNSGLTGRFEKGRIPENKGRKGYHSPGSEKGWFKKGQQPWNHANVGDEAWTTDGYLKVKIAEPNKWRQKHILVWEQHNGPVPKDHVVSFKDGNHANCAIENLVLLTRGEHATLNHLGLRCSDPEITETGITLARLQSKVYNATKKLKGEIK